MKFSLAPVAIAACVVSGLFVAAPAVAQEVQGSAWIDVTRVEFYGLVPGIPGSFRFYNNDQQLRGLTAVDEDNQSNYSGAQFRNTVNYSVLPTLPVTSDALVTANGSAYGRVNGTATEAGLTLNGLDRTGQGYGGVSTTATGQQTPGFWNLILGAHTGLVIDARSFAGVSLRDRCLVTCGDIFARAQLLAQFGPESLVDPGLPDLSQLITRRANNAAFLDGSSVTGSGSLLTFSFTQDLHLVFENLSDHEVMGRIRWDTTVIGNSAVPEPETYALMALGLGLLALRRRKAA